MRGVLKFKPTITKCSHRQFNCILVHCLVTRSGIPYRSTLGFVFAVIEISWNFPYSAGNFSYYAGIAFLLSSPYCLSMIECRRKSHSGKCVASPNGACLDCMLPGVQLGHHWRGNMQSIGAQLVGATHFCDTLPDVGSHLCSVLRHTVLKITD